MASGAQAVPVSNASLWSGRIMSGLVVAFLVFDSSIKLARATAAMEGTAKLGYPLSVVFPLGVVLLFCTVLYVIPRTSVLGAILLTGYLGGATASQVRLQDPWCLFPVGFGVLVWAGLFFRYERVRSLIPVRRSET